jgi:16S rRNA processing protein RimM
MDLFEAGKIVKTQGLKGTMKVASYLEKGDTLQSLTEVFIHRGSQGDLPFEVRKIRIQDRFFFLDLAGIDSIDAARDFVGCSLLIPRGRLAELPDDEFYWHELLGMEVVTQTGKSLGRIMSIFPTGSNDVYVCSDGETEILLPAISDVVKKIDRQNRKMVVELLEGL